MGNKTGKGKKNPTELLDTEIEFLLKNTNYNREQIIKWHNEFLLDCPKGELEKKKFLEVYKEFYPQAKAESYCTELFKLYDKDHSGKINFVEFLLAISTTSSNDPVKKLKMAFDLYDTNDNGRIDQKEMEKILVAIYDLKGIKDRDGPNSPKAKTAEIFAKMDTNFSNTLDEQEFIKGCMNDHELRSFLIEN